MRGKWTKFLWIFLFIVGLSLMLYPSVSNWWNTQHASGVIITYNAAQETLTEDELQRLLSAAESYNQKIAQLEFPLMYYDSVPDYAQMLNLDGSSAMGYITIPQINVKLPILHGTSDGVLQKAIGHLEGTSLPTGGEGNHCVLSAHRGLPSAKLFTDLDQMKIGDTFSISVLNRELLYEVDQILIVEPQEVDALYPVEGKDYCTLITCTPYGVNSHRLLVRGTRIFPTEEADFTVSGDAIELSRFWVTFLALSPLLAACIILLVLKTVRRKAR